MPVESKIAFDVCTVPPTVDAAVVPANVTKASDSFKSAIVAELAYNGLNNPVVEDEIAQVAVSK